MEAVNQQELFKKIPAVDRLLSAPDISALTVSYPRSLIVKAVHQVLDHVRARIRDGTLSEESQLSIESVSVLVVEKLKELSLPSLRPVINATGVVVHTNLGRSLLADRALGQFDSIA